MKVQCKSLTPRDITIDQSEAMWALFDATYMGADRESFEADYRKKEIILHLWEGSKLAGFTSLTFKDIGSQCVVYSGDIVIAPWARGIGTAVFFGAWGKQVWQKAHWWCALTSGVRTYRILHTFFNRTTPNPEGKETDEESRNRHLFAAAMYGSAYNAKTGIVHLANAYGLREESKPPRITDPVDAFFVRANPGWRAGDELVSLVSLAKENWKPVAFRMLTWKQVH